MPTKIYRIAVTNTERGYIEVKAATTEEAYDKAYEENNNGGFVSYNTDTHIDGVLEIRELP